MFVRGSISPGVSRSVDSIESWERAENSAFAIFVIFLAGSQHRACAGMTLWDTRPLPTGIGDDTFFFLSNFLRNLFLWRGPTGWGRSETCRVTPVSVMDGRPINRIGHRKENTWINRSWFAFIWNRLSNWGESSESLKKSEPFLRFFSKGFSDQLRHGMVGYCSRLIHELGRIHSAFQSSFLSLILFCRKKIWSALGFVISQINRSFTSSTCTR